MRRFALASLLLAACGDDGGSVMRFDAGIDAVDVDAPASNNTPVTITVRYNGAARTGARVHFQNPDSSLVESEDTDASGVASAVMPNGGFVTVVNAFTPGGETEGFYSLHTYGAVEPGDELVLEDDNDEPAVSELIIKAPIDPAGSVTQYAFSTPCNSDTTDSAGSAASTEVIFNVDDRCATTTDVLIRTLDANDEVVSWLYAPNQTVTGGEIDLSGMTFTAAATKTLTFTNIPAVNEGVQFANFFATPVGVLAEASGGGDAPTVTSMIKVAPFTGALDIVFALTGGMFSTNAFIDWGPYNATYSVDVGARLLRQATSAAAFDLEDRTITWSEASTGVAADFAAGGIEASFEDANTSMYRSWDIVTAYTAGQLQFPTLPVENNVDLNPTTSDVINLDAVSLGKVPGGYDAIRESFFGIDDPTELASTGTGSVTAQDIDPSGNLLQRIRRLVGAGKRKHPRATWKFTRRM